VATIAQVCRGGTSVEFDVLDIAGAPVVARDAGKPAMDVYPVGGTDSNRLDPRTADDLSAFDNIVVIGQFRRGDVFGDAQRLVEDLIKPIQAPSDDTLQLGIEFEQGAIFGAEIAPLYANSCTLEYETGETDTVVVRLIVRIVSCLDLTGGTSSSVTYTGYIGNADAVVDTTTSGNASVDPILDVNPAGDFTRNAIAFDGSQYIYVAGGDTGSAFATSVRRFDALNNSWESSDLTQLPTGRASHNMRIVDGTLVVFGGSDTYSSNESTDAVDLYDISTDTWSNGAVTSTARNFGAVVVKDGGIYWFGGYEGDTADNLATAEVYDVSADSWTTLTNTPVTLANWRGTLNTNNGLIYLGNDNTSNDFYSYDPSADSYTQLTAPSNGTNLLAYNAVKDVVWQVEDGPAVAEYDASADSWAAAGHFVDNAFNGLYAYDTYTVGNQASLIVADGEDWAFTMGEGHGYTSTATAIHAIARLDDIFADLKNRNTGFSTDDGGALGGESGDVIATSENDAPFVKIVSSDT